MKGKDWEEETIKLGVGARNCRRGRSQEEGKPKLTMHDRTINNSNKNIKNSEIVN